MDRQKVMKQLSADVIVVGSGPSAVHAAYPIVESGMSVVMLDVGHRDLTYEPLIPSRPFSEIRRTDPLQHRYFLGDRFEGVPLTPLGAGPQMTPPRKYVLQGTHWLSPILSHSFQALESLACGGLGCAWGAVSFPFLNNELVKAGLPPEEMSRQYDIVARRIGISGCKDDLEQLRGVCTPLLPPLEIDQKAKTILSCYERRREAFQRAGLYVGRPIMAVLTQPLNGREANRYNDMDFWSNVGRSIYWPVSTLHDLESRKNFSYRSSYLVETFAEVGESVAVCARFLETGRKEVFTGHRLVLAAGALGTGRIVLRSLAQYNVPVPITCNMHVYIPCLHHSSLGRAPDERCHSLAQLTIIYDPTRDREHLVQAQSYSYRSLLLFRLLKELPLPFPESIRIMRTLSSSMVVFVIQFEDYQNVNSHCVLRHDRDRNEDYLQIDYEVSKEAQYSAEKAIKVLRRSMRHLGCLPFRTVEPGHGSSVHYGSLLPFSLEEKPLTTEPSGRLRGTDRVYVADGAAFTYLPAKGVTMTLMANANRVGQNVAASISI